MANNSTPNSNKKAWTIVAFIALVGAGGVIIFRMLKNRRLKNRLYSADSVPDSAASKPKQASSVSSSSATSIFPLKNGSPKNALVAQLQALLGIPDDGIFGPQTQGALIAATGKSSIATQAEFDSIINKLKTAPAIKTNQARANQLISDWKKSSTLQLMPIEATTMVQVLADAAGALIPTGKQMSLPKLLKLNRADYVPVGSTTQGFLRVDVTRGDLKGSYKVDPNKMTLA